MKTKKDDLDVLDVLYKQFRKLIVENNKLKKENSQFQKKNSGGYGYEWYECDCGYRTEIKPI